MEQKSMLGSNSKIWKYPYRFPLSSLIIQFEARLKWDFKRKSTTDKWNAVEHCGRVNSHSNRQVIESTLFLGLPIVSFHSCQIVAVFSPDNHVPLGFRFLFLGAWNLPLKCYLKPAVNPIEQLKPLAGVKYSASIADRAYIWKFSLCEYFRV